MKNDCVLVLYILLNFTKFTLLYLWLLFSKSKNKQTKDFPEHQTISSILLSNTYHLMGTTRSTLKATPAKPQHHALCFVSAPQSSLSSEYQAESVKKTKSVFNWIIFSLVIILVIIAVSLCLCYFVFSGGGKKRPKNGRRNRSGKSPRKSSKKISKKNSKKSSRKKKSSKRKSSKKIKSSKKKSSKRKLLSSSKTKKRSSKKNNSNSIQTHTTRRNKTKP